MTDTNSIYNRLGVSDQVLRFGQEVLEGLTDQFRHIDQVAEFNQAKVIAAMQKNRVNATHFNLSTGYGYDDEGRDNLERVYADCFGAEAALVRPQITCGTHALALALGANLLPGDELLSPVGGPYDTLEEVIGIRPSPCSLKEYGVSYRQVDLLPDGGFDYDGIRAAINEKTRLITIQRSKGYATRPSYSVEEIGKLIAFCKECKPDVLCMVDNCYGEFVETQEPTNVGADMVVGSLIKNLGGGLAPTGGYICGRKSCIERCAYRLSAPGLGREVGANLGLLTSFYQGLFLAPTVVSSAVRGAVFAAGCYERLGFRVVPGSGETRRDIIQAVELGSREAMVAFCKGIQSAAPVDSYVTPEPWAMPGYESEVIMAAGAFVQGASIELSADGPIRPPYAVYFQGGLTWFHAKLGILMSIQKLLDAGIIEM
ncbi:methionine gamma-lyase family protein [Oscillospiraceae bacterium CLA-AA-H272]|uniref:Methionine gamma-lyase family protein n=1 Tax=Brotocaccenecus cirricatena TaxID=3064195 RepID=A0AAE3AHQ3_9FIRM|nr:methionine gamma-lyase family protein [Brotocaccenecus cirricatena]MCC2130271.1 methionine gamma-lyase family protein [Brotocaccenecus cirricatena]